MSLDLTKVVAQVGSMVARLQAGRAERQQRLRYALDTFHQQAGNIENLQKKIDSARTTWLVAGLVEGLDHHYQPAPLPEEFTVIATDGSHIDVDRHRSARCYLINIGAVSLHYGASPLARLESFPRLYSEDKDLVIAPPEGKGRDQPVEGLLLGVKRSVGECQHLVGLGAAVPGEGPLLALLDGSLILWSLEAYPEFVTELLLKEGFLHCLSEFRKLNGSKKAALASYISVSGSTEVVNALRVAICPDEPVDCDRCQKRVCDVLAGITDRELLWDLLNPGERSAIFANRSSVVEKYYGEHRVYFFYLRLDDEIARVEIPAWVALDKELLNLVHTLVLDQCRRGHGYPVALSEAHEQAVVTGADREQFWQLVSALMAEEHLPERVSGKSQSKRTRWV